MTREESYNRIDAIIAKYEIDDEYVTITNPKDYDALRIARKALEQEPCEMTAEEYRQRMIQAFHNADTDGLIAICVLPTEKEFEHLEWLLKNHYKKEPYEELNFVQPHRKVPVNLEVCKMREATQKEREGVAQYIDSIAEECDDTISRRAAIDAVEKNTFKLTFAEEQNCEGHVAWSAEAVYSDVIEGALLELPPINSQPKIGHWIDIDATHSKCDRCGAVFEIASETARQITVRIAVSQRCRR